MSFINPESIKKIFGDAPVAQQGAFDPKTPQGQQMVAMLANAGAGMTQAANQPGANFAQALGGGAQGMMQGQQQAMQQRAAQMQLEAQQREMERLERAQKAFDSILGGTGGGSQPDFASRVDTGLPRISGAQASPAAPPASIAAAPPNQDMPLGFLSEQFESGGRGVDTISTGQNDPGGVSYGRHQLSTKAGTWQDFLQSPEGQPFAMQFGDIEPGTEPYNEIYREVAEGVGPEFDQAQRQYLERTHVRPTLQQAQRVGIDVSNRGVQEALYSMGVQHSGAGNLQILNAAASRLPENATPDQTIKALYDARGAYADQFVDSSAGSERYEREREQALAFTRGPNMQQAEMAVGMQPQQPQQPQNGYQADVQQASGGVGGAMQNMTPQQRQLLAALGPEAGMQMLAEQAFREPEQTAAMRNARAVAGDDEDLYRQLMRQQVVGDSGGDQRDRKIADAQRFFGIDEATATGVVDGYIRTEINENTGRVILTDMTDPTNPTVREIPIGGQGAGAGAGAGTAAPQSNTEETMFDVVSEGNIAGVLPAIGAGYTRTLGQIFPVTEGMQDAQYDRQLVLDTSRDLVKALQNNPRYAEGERQAIEKEISIKPEVLQSTEGMLSRMEAIRASLIRRYENAMRDANDPNKGEEIRTNAQRAATDIANYLRVMGRPAEEESPAQALSADDQDLIDRWAD